MLQSYQSTSRFDYIDSLRGFAILFVIMAHSANATQMNGTLRAVTDGGLMGVHLFFMISAFTIFHMLTKHVQEEQNPVRNFFIRRFFRLVPVYWFGILFYIAVLGLLPRSQWWHYPVHLTLTNALFPRTQIFLAVPGGWSISVEMLFYLSVPLWFKWVRSLRQAWIFMLVSVFVLPLVTFALRQWMDPLLLGIQPYLINYYWERFPLNSLGSFSFGILLFFLLKDERVTLLIRNKNVGLLMIGFVTLVLPLLGMFDYIYPLKPHFYCIFFMLLALALAHNPHQFFVNPATIFIGRISYSMYLFHFAVLIGWIKWVPKHMPYFSVAQPEFFLITYVVVLLGTVFLALGGYLCIERPAIEASKRLIFRLERKSAMN